MPKKPLLISGVILSVLLLGVFWLTAAPAVLVEPKVCGNGIVESPNDAGDYEKCDDSLDGSDACTPECGEKMLGWAWSPIVGWVSLNSQNCRLLPANTCDIGVEYFTSLNADNQISGWAWSQNAGWICFGKTCADLTGFGDAIPLIRGEPKWEALIEDFQSQTPTVIGWGKILIFGDDGWVSFSCKNNEPDTCDASNYQVLASKSTFTFIQPDSSENVVKRYSINGWAYNGSNSNNKIGWLSFSPSLAPIDPWLQAQYGDVYAQKGILGTPAPTTAYNATYRILANNTITGFSSAQAEALWLDPLYGQINFPSAQTRYSNALGSLDVNGLVCDFKGNPTCVNKYGLITVDTSKNPLDFSRALGGKVYLVASDLTIADLTTTIKNAVGYESGAGTIIVNGDLTINGDVAYEPSGTETRFKNLAALAWIVKGDLKIAGNVRNVAGNFIVLGDGTLCAETGIGPAHCGQVFSCYDEVCGTAPLTVNGFIMTRKFNFNRTFTVAPPAVQPAESVVYDGRLLANTPPGLADFAKAMPLWRANITGQ